MTCPFFIEVLSTGDVLCVARDGFSLVTCFVLLAMGFHW